MLNKEGCPTSGVRSLFPFMPSMAWKEMFFISISLFYFESWTSAVFLILLCLGVHCAFHSLLCCCSVSVLGPWTTTGCVCACACVCVSIVMGVIDCLGSLAGGQIYLLTLQIPLSSLSLPLPLLVSKWLSLRVCQQVFVWCVTLQCFSVNVLAFWWKCQHEKSSIPPPATLR